MGAAPRREHVNVAEIARRLSLSHDAATFLVQYVVCADGVRPVKLGPSRLISIDHMPALVEASKHLKEGIRNFYDSIPMEI